VAPPGEGWKVLGYTLGGVAVSFAIFATIRMFAGKEPSTMTKEYQEASNEYLIVRPPLLAMPKHTFSSVPTKPHYPYQTLHKIIHLKQLC
jgi:hypothetical protein